MSVQKAAGLILFAAVITSVVNGGHSRVPIELSLQLRLFDPKYDSPQHGKGITVNSAVSFRHGDPVRLVSGGECDLPEFDEPQTFGTIIDADVHLKDGDSAQINLKLQMSSRFTDNRQRDVHLVDGELIHVCCPVVLGKPRTIKCSDGRSLEILLQRSE